MKVAPPQDDEIGRLNGDNVLIGFLSPLTDPDRVRALAASGATAFALEAVQPLLHAINRHVSVRLARSTTYCCTLPIRQRLMNRSS